MFDEVIKLDPQYDIAYYYKGLNKSLLLALSLYDLKQYKESKVSFQKYLEFYPDDDDTK